MNITEENSQYFNKSEELFSSQEIQYITNNIIQSIRCEKGEDLEYLNEFIDIYEGQSVVAVLERFGKIYQVYPLHEQEKLKILEEHWIKQLWSDPPLGI